jgi:hypothetical protein
MGVPAVRGAAAGARTRRRRACSAARGSAQRARRRWCERRVNEKRGGWCPCQPGAADTRRLGSCAQLLSDAHTHLPPPLTCAAGACHLRSRHVFHARARRPPVGKKHADVTREAHACGQVRVSGRVVRLIQKISNSKVAPFCSPLPSAKTSSSPAKSRHPSLPHSATMREVLSIHIGQAGVQVRCAPLSLRACALPKFDCARARLRFALVLTRNAVPALLPPCADRQRLLGAVLPGARHPARWPGVCCAAALLLGQGLLDPCLVPGRAACLRTAPPLLPPLRVGKPRVPHAAARRRRRARARMRRAGARLSAPAPNGC